MPCRLCGGVLITPRPPACGSRSSRSAHRDAATLAPGRLPRRKPACGCSAWVYVAVMAAVLTRTQRRRGQLAPAQRSRLPAEEQPCSVVAPAPVPSS